jgi:hypothetical protein
MKPVKLQAGSNVPEEYTAFASRIMGYAMFVREAGTYVPAYTVPQPRKLQCVSHC